MRVHCQLFLFILEEQAWFLSNLHFLHDQIWKGEFEWYLYCCQYNNTIAMICVKLDFDMLV